MRGPKRSRSALRPSAPGRSPTRGPGGHTGALPVLVPPSADAMVSAFERRV
jgi:hypothetical protein